MPRGNSWNIRAPETRTAPKTLTIGQERLKNAYAVDAAVAGLVCHGKLKKGAPRNRHLTMIALGGIIGASLFVGSGSVIASAGPAALLCYAIGDVLVVLVMRMLGEWTGGPAWVFALALLLILTISNLLSVRSFGETELWLASIKVGKIVVFLVVGTLWVLGLYPKSHFSVSNLAYGGWFPHGAFPTLEGVVTMIFTYFGTEVVPWRPPSRVSRPSDRPRDEYHCVADYDLLRRIGRAAADDYALAADPFHSKLIRGCV